MVNFSKTTLLIILLAIFLIIASIFGYQWWQIKGELARQIEENENLKNQIAELEEEIDRLQKEIEELKTIEGKIRDETAGWKTYRNEEYGFEIDYPMVGWEFKWLGPNGLIFEIEKRLGNEISGAKGYPFYIAAQVEFLANDGCSIYSFEEIIKSRELMLRCVVDAAFAMNFEKEIVTNFGVKGYKGKGSGYRYGLKGSGIEAVIFPILKEEIKWGKRRIKWRETEFQPFLIIYCDLETNYIAKDIEVFDEIISSFRYIE